MASDNAKTGETVPEPRLEWLRELDRSMAAIDSRLTRPRRPLADAAAFPEAAPESPGDAPPVLRPGKMLMIRYRMPRLPWPFRLLQ
jgi:hypothetical protein